ncbi:MAG: TIGR01459 family HAD-type hydrolase [Parvularculaceae bacterium]|jgi:HAD superfamily hydrolase (TIGR01459 family)|nr:TIGR01459 family HAD-type hydrolase [Parvularculaceae bacterium]
MLLTPIVQGLASLARDYDAMLCDAWGVIHNGVALFDGAAEALLAFRRERGPVIILTNAPRPSAVIPAQLDRLGLPRDAYDAVVTSGDATRAEVEKRRGQNAFRIGPSKDEELYRDLDVRFTPLDEADFIICSGLDDDVRESPEDYRPLLEAAASRRIPMICANPDVVVRLGGRLIFCAGALAEIYAALGAEVVYAGKPHAPIYELSLKRIGMIAGRDIPSGRVLAIGDGVMTDIKGANGRDIDAVLVAGEGGVHEGPLSAVDLTAQLAKAGVRVRAAMERLKW